jgi:altronate hydrolase
MTPFRAFAPTLRLHPLDNVLVALRPLSPGQIVEDGEVLIEVRTPIPPGHKVAARRIPQDAPITKYGQTIGNALDSIFPGDHVHVQNVTVRDFARDYAFCQDRPPLPPPAEPRTFLGFDRGNGRWGTRNYLALISTVNCSASTSKYIAEKLRTRGVLDGFSNVDGVVPITHKGGCAMQDGGPDHRQLERTLAGFAQHANVAAYILIGLGCETGQAATLIEREQLVQLDRRRPPPPVLSIQECGGIAATVDAGVKLVAEMLPRINDVKRTPLPASRLILGTNCGGSDGYSGITANPALGYAADLLVQQGGTVILGETPELYGAEHLLTRRAVTPAVGEKLIERIKWWEWYTSMFGAAINNNPSPGNKDGGLTTIFEKSLGAMAKGGTTALVDVVHYAEPVRTPGLVVMDTPGFDPVSMTGIVAGGANVLVFTTGRGSVYGCKPVPSLKVATNSRLFHHMNADMDIDAGTIVDGTPVAAVGRAIFEAILATASGAKTKSERAGVGEEEFAPWSIGPTL